MTSFLLLAALLVADGPKPVTLERVGRLEHPAIGEASGIVKSRKYPGVFWVHNDSGNAPRLFAVRRDGGLIREYMVKIPNVDWEDIAIDNAGHLYLGEIGNNEGRLPLRAVYMLDEPDPNLDTAPALKVITACYYLMSRENRFDAEGLVIDGDRALIVSKTFDSRDAEVFSIPFAPPAPLMKPAKPKLTATLRGFTSPVTGASLTPDGKWLAVCATDLVGVYERSKDATWTPLFLQKFRPSDGQVEAITWDDADLILTGEGRQMLRLPAKVWQARHALDRTP